jgi:hypothetical protein
MNTTIAHVVGASARVGSRFLSEPTQMKGLPALEQWDHLDGEGLCRNRRVLRADDLTRLCALVVQQSIGDRLDSWSGENVGIVTASVSASARTNEGYESRRQQGRKAEARAFAYTAPNAALGELSTALGAKGPSLSIVGGMEAGLVAMHRARGWLARGYVDRVVVLAHELPTECEMTGWSLVPCAACLLLTNGEFLRGTEIRVRWEDSGNETPTGRFMFGAAGALIELALAYITGQKFKIRVVPEQGAALVAALGANGDV